MKTARQKVLIIIPCYNEEDCLDALLKSIQKNIQELTKNFNLDILFVNDGSVDKTGEVLRQLSAKNKNVYYREFAQNVGHQSALRAGIDTSDGYDAVIMMDADMQHPPELIPQLVEAWQSGYKIVQMLREDDGRDDVGLAKKLLSKLYYWLINELSDLDLEPGASDFRLIDGSIASAVAGSREKNLFLRGYFSWLKVSRTTITYVPNKRLAGKSKYSFNKMLKLAYTGVLQFSEKPLRFSVGLGALVAILAFAYGIYLIIRHSIGNYGVSGWTSLMVVVLVCSGINFMLFGIVGAYLAHSIGISKQRPEYIISSEELPLV